MLRAVPGQEHRLICWRCLHTGGTDSLAIDIKLLLGVALVCLAGSFVLAHNHPSGNVQPSKADVAFTNRIRTACAAIDIPMLDHLILTRTEAYSFAEEMW